MNGEKLFGYFLLLTAGGTYVSLLFWSGYYIFSRRLNRQKHALRAIEQAAPRPYWAQRP